jgi:SAM-dependent methyltransferase
VILASNLLCRLPSPRRFISTVSNFLKPNGMLVLVSPYSWLEEYTEKQEWFGGRVSESGQPIDSYDELKEFISANGIPLAPVSRDDIPFLIREHERKFQYGVSDCNIWKKI